MQLQSLPQHDDDHSDSASYASELSGFDNDNETIQQSEIQAILRPKSQGLVDHHLWIYRGKMNKWARELKKQSRIQDMKKTSGLIPAAGSPTLPGLPEDHDDSNERRDYWHAKWKHQIYQKLVRKLEHAQQGALKRPRLDSMHPNSNLS